MGVRTRAAAVLLAALGLLATTAAPAVAQSVSTGDTRRVLGDLRESRVTIDLGGGARARGNLLHFPAADPHLDLRPRLARGTAAGVQQVPTLARNRLGRGAVAGTTAGTG